MENIIVRKARIEDASSLSALSRQLGYPCTTGQLSIRLNSILKTRDHVVFVSCADKNKVTGWIHVFFTHRLESDPFAEIGGFIVGKTFRGMGVGKELLTTAEKWCRENDILSLKIRSREERSEAHAKFKHWGFSRIKKQFVFNKQINPNLI